MAISKSKMGSGSSPKQPNSGRRSFIRRAGAAMSAVLASAVAGISKSGPDQDTGLTGEMDRLSNQIKCLEDANEIRGLHQTYESFLDKGMYEEVVNLFADEGSVVFNGGIFSGRNNGVRRLYCSCFSRGETGKKIEPAPGFEPDNSEQQTAVSVASDRKTATCQFPYSMQVGEPMNDISSLVAMARLQGGGITKWWEGGICEAFYVKIGKNWKIRKLEYRAVSKANYRPGQTYAKPIEVPAFSSVFPKDPTGPDRLV